MRGQKNAANAVNRHSITEGVIWQQLLLFFFPILFGTFFQQLYNTVDAIVVGNFVGKEALAAVGGSTGTFINLLVGFFVGLSSGATVIISQYYGAEDNGRVSEAVHTSIALAIAGGAVMTAIGIAISRVSLEAMNTPADIMDPSLIYMRIYFLGTIPSMIYNMGSGILRAVGDSKRPLYFLIASCFINIVLDLFFVVVLQMGVAGAAIATILSQTLSALMTVIALMKTSNSYRLILSRIRFHKVHLINIVKIGLPAGLQSAMYSISNLLIQSSINAFGTDTVAAWTAFGKVDSFYWLVSGAFGVSITTFVSQNFGARKYDRVKKGVLVCLALAAVTSVLLSFIVVAFGGTILLLFTRDAEVISICEGIIRLVAPTYITYICIEILSGTCRGCGDSFIPMILTCFGVCVLRIVWIFVAVPLRNDISTVVFSYPLTWTITSVLFILYYKKGHWMQKDSIADAPASPL